MYFRVNIYIDQNSGTLIKYREPTDSRRVKFLKKPLEGFEPRPADYETNPDVPLV